MAKTDNPGALAGATGAEMPIHAVAEGIQQIPHSKTKRHKSGATYRVAPGEGEPFDIVVSGRVRWALEELRKAGAKGCTPIKNPAPRWSAYVYDLRDMGVDIQTITEPHAGAFPGHHGRYVLRDVVRKGGQ